MADESHRFHTIGPSWSERAKLAGLRTVLSPTGPDRSNYFLHGIHLFGARRALGLTKRANAIVDFGCGAGRFVRLFGESGRRVVGTEITREMIAKAESEGTPSNCSLVLTNGIEIPLADSSVDLVWCCAVLRYSLLVADPVYDKIAAEMFRVLRAGGFVVNVEMYVKQSADVFVKDFEMAGFVTRRVRVIHRYNGRPERFFAHRSWPLAAIPWAAQRCAQLRYWFDSPERDTNGLRDYLFIWEKPRITE